MKVILRASDGWESKLVPYAQSFWQRWRGMRRDSASDGLLIKTNSVHGRGMERSFRAVALSGSFEVLGSQVVDPGQFVRFPRARYVLELPSESPGPAIGARLMVTGA